MANLLVPAEEIHDAKPAMVICKENARSQAAMCNTVVLDLLSSTLGLKSGDHVWRPSLETREQGEVK